MYAYREIMILDDPQKLVLREPLPLKTGQVVELLVVSDTTFSPSTSKEISLFLEKRDRLLAENSDEFKGFMSNRPTSVESCRDPFLGWSE
jgi:hypothetical protein